ncbi:MAG: hypothetical protein SF187_30970 [Deltaproteobacteria bacterium]|nr:hypothetical protein [Deltaproteobacteria bacterium]
MTVKHLDDGYMGNLRAGPAEDSVRHVRDGACEAVVSALALMVVLAVDPRTGEGVNHKAAEDGSQRRVTAPAQTSPPTVPKRPLSQWRLSATGVGRTDLWRSLAMGAGLSLWWARSHTEQKWQWSPAVGVMVAHAPRTELPLQADAGRARFDWTAGALSACAAAFNRPPFMLRGPCLGLNVGAIRGQGLDLAQPRDATRLWLSVEATVQMSVHPGGPFFIRVVGGAAMPLLRHQFVFRSPDVLLYQTPGLGAVAMVDVGVIF